MSDNTKAFVGITLSVFIAVLGALFIFRPANTPKLGSSINSYALNSTISGGVNLPTGTSTIVSLPDTARVYGILCNTDKVANDYLGFSNYTLTATNTAASGLATTTAGVVIFPASCYRMDNLGNLVWSQINATTASTATTTLLYMFGH